MDSRDAAGEESGRVSALYAATRDLLTAPDRESLCEVAVRTGEEILGLPFVSVHLVEAGRLQPVATTAAVRERYDEVPTYGPGDPVWDVFDGGEPVAFDDVRDADVAAGVVVPIGSHGVLIAGAADEREVKGSGVELVRLLADNTAVALDRLDRERRLDRLHRAARELMTARDTASVAAAATNAAHEILGLRVNAVFLRSSDGDRLVPVSVTEEAKELFGEIPDLKPGSVAWRGYEDGEAEIHDDVRTDRDVQNPETPARSEVVLPLGDHGVFIAGTTEVDAFAESDLSLARVFADNVEAALDRAEREAMVRNREGELARQNERLEEFASVVSHDLRNPLNVAQGRVELAMDDCDSEHLEHAHQAHERMVALIEDLLALARNGQGVGDVESVALAPLAHEVWATVEGGTLDVHENVGAVDADPSRLRELFENLFRNAVEHGSTNGRTGPGDAGEHGSEPGSVTVEVGPLDGDGGFYVADDGPGIPPGDREAVFERGFTTAEEGTGFGLPIVREIAEAHGWRVAVTDGALEGARFEIRTDSE
ncbi:sensor histidine kinase [Halorarum salinum]|uniref:histidine kinase n=1 Tax=Halorarum salinum TaxID=2743089 RepID=A0A7D5L9G3_9EURY|nr:GAF domain-containing sensor histidine kinase [Halobaculum salinum]QLG61194.1 GAF domain-containing sensor histidine kinase [Halobaculum salinum]